MRAGDGGGSDGECHPVLLGGGVRVQVLKYQRRTELGLKEEQGDCDLHTTSCVL